MNSISLTSTDSLANVLAGLGVLTKDNAGAFAPSDYGEELRASLA